MPLSWALLRDDCVPHRIGFEEDIGTLRPRRTVLTLPILVIYLFMVSLPCL